MEGWEPMAGAAPRQFSCRIKRKTRHEKTTQSQAEIPLPVPAKAEQRQATRSAKDSCGLHDNGRRPDIKLDRQTVHVLVLPTCMT